MNKENNKKEDDIAILCIRCDDLTQPIRGAIKKKCDFCGAKVWISPGSQDKKFDKIYCMQCWQLDYDEKEDEMYYTKENIAEFNSWLLENQGYEMKEEDILEMMEQGTGTKVKKLKKNKLDKK